MKKSRTVRRALGAAAALVCLIGTQGVVEAQSPTPGAEVDTDPVVTTNRNCRELAADLRQRATDLLANSVAPVTTTSVDSASTQAAARDRTRSSLSEDLVERANHADVVTFGSEQAFWVRTNEYGSSNPPGRPDAIAVLATDDGVIVIEQKPRYVVLFRYDDFGKKQQAKLRVEGQFIDARLVNGSVQLVSEAPPQLKGTDAAAIAATKTHHWIPRYAWRAPDGSWERKTLTRCPKTYVPQDLSGLSVVSLTNLDPDTLKPTRGVGVVTDNARVALKGQRAVVVTPRSVPAATTSIHLFDLSHPFQAKHLASSKTPDSVEDFGLVDDGHLAAALCEPPRLRVQPDDASCSISTFAALDGELRTTGQSHSIGTRDDIWRLAFFDNVAFVNSLSVGEVLVDLTFNLPDRGPLAMTELEPDVPNSYVLQLAPDRLLFVYGAYLQLFDIADAANPIELATQGEPPRDHEPGEMYGRSETFPDSFDWDPDLQTFTHVYYSWTVNDPYHPGGRPTTWAQVWKVTDDGIVYSNRHEMNPDRYVDIEFRTRIEGDEVRAVIQGAREERFSRSPGR